MEDTIDIYDIKPISLTKEPRPIQKQLLKFSQDCIQNNIKNIMIDAPTGCLTRNEKINIYILKDKHINNEETTKCNDSL